jgi:imidazole glycerol phosphate synthase glutamine amidotransferase subunit
VKITLIDNGAGNVASVERALSRLGAASERASGPEAITSAGVIILPGVGHYSALVRALDERNLRRPLLGAIARGVPFLGICLGLQSLYESSDEAPDLAGLGVLPGRVSMLPTSVKLPHMGWNQLQSTANSRLLAGIDKNAFFYFAHSFAATDADQSTVATCAHGSKFVAVVERDNLCAVQFHPEKSGAPGAQLLQNFLGFAV